MDIRTFFFIIVWAFVAVFVIAAFFITFIYGRHTVKDDSRKAWIFLKTGRHISKPMRGILKGNPTKAGSKYTYNKGQNVVFVPASYAENYHKNRRFIYISRMGQLIATPMPDDKTLSSKEKDELIYEIVSSHIGSDAIRALRGKATMGIVVVAIIAFIVGAVGVFGFMQFQKIMAQNQAAQSQQETPPNNQIEIKPEVK